MRNVTRAAAALGLNCKPLTFTFYSAQYLPSNGAYLQHRTAALLFLRYVGIYLCQSSILYCMDMADNSFNKTDDNNNGRPQNFPLSRNKGGENKI